MRQGTAPAIEQPRDRDIAETDAELSDVDLECVVGGLARPWTETEPDDPLAEPAPRVR